MVSRFDCADPGRNRPRFPTRFVVNLSEATFVHAIGEEVRRNRDRIGRERCRRERLNPPDLRPPASTLGAKMRQLLLERCDGARKPLRPQNARASNRPGVLPQVRP
jgi:hypothetical protein